MKSERCKSIRDKLKRFLPKKSVPQTRQEALRRVIIVTLFLGMLNWVYAIWGIRDKPSIAETLVDMALAAFFMIFLMRDAIFQNGD